MGLFSWVRSNLIKKKPEGKLRDPRAQIVGDYINACSQYSKRVTADVSLLPHPKEKIQSAMLWQMSGSEAARKILPPIFVGTAIYQKSVASRDALELLDAVEAEMTALQAVLREHGYQ